MQLRMVFMIDLFWDWWFIGKYEFGVPCNPFEKCVQCSSCSLKICVGDYESTVFKLVVSEL